MDKEKVTDLTVLPLNICKLLNWPSDSSLSLGMIAVVLLTVVSIFLKKIQNLFQAALHPLSCQ